MLAAVAVPAVVFLGGRSTAAAGGTVVSATDYAFSPSRLSWRPGQRVTVTIANDSDANPGKPHEFMMGRRPLSEPTPFGARPGDGYASDFFAGVRVRVVRARGLTMLMPGAAKVSGAAARQPTGGGNSMPGMNMSGNDNGSMPGMDMSGGQGAGGGGNSMPGMSMPPAGAGKPRPAQGFMVVLKAGGSVTISFVVPNRPGTWEFGCFQGDGEHYLNGMKGVADVARA